MRQLTSLSSSWHLSLRIILLMYEDIILIIQRRLILQTWHKGMLFSSNSPNKNVKISQLLTLITQVVHLLFPWRYHGTIWEQQTHWESAFLLKISGSAYSVVNLDKMYLFDSHKITKRFNLCYVGVNRLFEIWELL